MKENISPFGSRRKKTSFVTLLIAIGLLPIGCLQTTQVEEPFSAFVAVNLVATGDSNLAYFSGRDTVRTPVALRVERNQPATVSIIPDQRFDLDSNVEGPDTRWTFTAWSDTASTNPNRVLVLSRSKNLAAAFCKRVKVVVCSRVGSRLSLVDSSWRTPGEKMFIPAPQISGTRFSGWRINGRNVTDATPLALAVVAPTTVEAKYQPVCTLSVQSDWSAGLPIKINDSAAVTPYNLEAVVGQSVKISVAANIEEDVSTFVDGNDVILATGNPQATSKRRSLRGYGTHIILLDSSKTIVIPTQRSYKVFVGTLPDTAGDFSFTADSGTSTIIKKSLYLSLGVGQPSLAAPKSLDWEPESTLIHLRAKPRADFIFSKWTYNGKTETVSDSLDFRVSWPTNLTAVFVPRFTLNLETFPDTSLNFMLGDSTLPAPWSRTYSSKTTVTIGATTPQERTRVGGFGGPDTRYIFNRWRDDSLAPNPRPVTVDTPTSLTAIYRSVYRTRLYSSNSATQIDSVDTWYADGDKAVFVAKPDSWSKVLYWEINGVRYDGGDTLVLDVNHPLILKPHFGSKELRLRISNLFKLWQPALGGEGGDLAMKLVSAYGGGCPTFGSADELVNRMQGVRDTLLGLMGLDPARPVLSQEIQKRFQGPGYTVEVARLEIYPGNYLPVNIYLPDNKDPASCPLIVSPPGFNQGASLDLVQARAGNFAMRGMVVMVPEGYNSNGVRAAYQGYNNYLLYARELLGLPSSNSAFLQEMMSAITWVLATYPQTDPNRIAVSGYSYGGGMSVELAQVDTRITSLSVPATNFGASCGAQLINPDIQVESAYGTGFVWSPPPEMPILSPNTDVAMLYPRFLHTVSGLNDAGAPPAFMSPVMSLASKWYSMGGLKDRVLFQSDSGDHNYGQARRQQSYSWFDYSLLADSLKVDSEFTVPIFSEANLEPNISGTVTLVQELRSTVDREASRRFQGTNPTGDYRGRVAKGMTSLFGDYSRREVTISESWKESGTYGLAVRAYKVATANTHLPVFMFENPGSTDSTQAIYLPLRGTVQDSGSLVDLISKYRRVYCIDYMGIGELRSNSVMLHTLARTFMFNSPSLPKLIVNDLRDFVASLGGRFDVFGNGWASSFFAASLKYLEPGKIDRADLVGLPTNEIEYLSSGNKVPDLLLWGGLFSKVTAQEIFSTAQPQ